LLGSGVEITAEDLPGEMRGTRVDSDAIETGEKYINLTSDGIDFSRLERELVEQALELVGGNQTRAAKLLGMNRDQIRYRIEKFGIGNR